ncbi:MAG: prolyl oligopeptidase family serine peptidase [Gammaproteobacteria bacterium]|nr:prolyl oligopeptidase family serine peptidase [Gammaproteobacteria bacterium]
MLHKRLDGWLVRFGLFLLLFPSYFLLAQEKVDELEAIMPQNETFSVGLAGDDPARIGRYLMASGASGARISPDGSYIAMRHSASGEPQLWVMPASGGQMQQLTFGSGITFFRWAPDSRWLLFGADNDGNEQESYALIRVDGLHQRNVLPPVTGGFRQFGDFSNDGLDLFYSSTERNGLDFDIYKTELASGETTLLYQGSYGYYARNLSPDGRFLVVTEGVGEDGDNLYLLDTESRELRVIPRPDPRASHGSGGFAWSPDSAGFFLASNVDREYTALMYYEIDSERLRMVQAFDNDAGDVTLCGSSSEFLAWTVNIDGFDTLMYKAVVGESVQTVGGLPEGNYTINCARDSSVMAIHISGWRTPGDIHHFDFDQQTLQRVFASNLAGLDPDRLIRPESIRIPARDGVMLQGLLYLPDSGSYSGEGAPPVIFEVHGGPTSQSRPVFDPIVQYHVDRGVAVFEPNVRGSTGFGRTYATLDDRTRRLDSVSDLVDMLESFRIDGRVDVERAAVSGGSYGGYMVNAVLAAFPGLFKAGVSRYGIADWVTGLEVASPQLKASDRIEYGDINLPEWRSFYETNSPIVQADRIEVPVLYSHGEMDSRIDVAESETMVRALRANGINAPFIRIPDEGHGWRKLINRQFYYRREAEFIESVLNL